jgi:hypothetical protein
VHEVDCYSIDRGDLGGRHPGRAPGRSPRDSANDHPEREVMNATEAALELAYGGFYVESDVFGWVRIGAVVTAPGGYGQGIYCGRTKAGTDYVAWRRDSDTAKHWHACAALLRDTIEVIHEVTRAY